MIELTDVFCSSYESIVCDFLCKDGYLNYYPVKFAISTGKLPVIFRLYISVSIFLAVTGKKLVKRTYIPVNYLFFSA